MRKRFTLVLSLNSDPEKAKTELSQLQHVSSPEIDEHSTRFVHFIGVLPDENETELIGKLRQITGYADLIHGGPVDES